MKKAVVFFTMVLVLGCSGSSNKPAALAPQPTTKPAVTSTTPTCTCVPREVAPGLDPKAALLTMEHYEQLRERIREVGGWVEQMEDLLGQDPKWWLRKMDTDLALTEKGAAAVGSWTDYFLPNASRALDAGATKQEVSKRIERAIQLAQKGKYISSYMQGLMESGGPAAVRKDAAGLFAKPE